MKKIIFIVYIYISIISLISAENIKILHHGEYEEAEHYFTISLNHLTIKKLQFFSSYNKNNNNREISLIWIDNKHELTLEEYKKSLRKIFKIFKNNFPNKKLKSIRTTISLVDSTYNNVNKVVKKYLAGRKGLARMKDKKLHSVVEKSLLKTKQILITCELSLELLHQKCHEPLVYIDPIAISDGFHEKKSWKSLSTIEKALSTKGLMSIYLGN